MDVKKRLLRKPLTTVLWVLLVAVMAAFLTVAAAMRFSTARLARSLDESHTAIAVRSDHEVICYTDELGTHYLVQDGGRTFPAEERAWLEGLDSVKAVHIHSLSGGYSPDFEASLGLRREKSWRPEGNASSYHFAILTGTVESVVTDMWGYNEGYRNSQGVELVIRVDEIVAMHPEFRQVLENNSQSESAYVYLQTDIYPEKIGDDIPPYFQKGQKYAFTGIFESSMRVYPIENGDSYVFCASMLGSSCLVRDGALREAEPEWDPRTGEHLGVHLAENSAMPMQAEPMEGSWADLLASSKNAALWQQTYDNIERQLHSLPVLGTESLESVYQFVTNETAITEGRSFTREEYDAGAHVMVISQEVARKHDLAVGDTVDFGQFLLRHNDAHYVYNSSMDTQDTSGKLSNPNIGGLDPTARPTEAEPFTIVGIYSMASLWPQGSYAFSADTVFIPKKAQIDGAFSGGRPSVPQSALDAGVAAPEDDEIFGVYLSVELVNGQVEAFRRAVANSPYVGEFYTVEQGYEAVQKSLNGLEESSGQMFWIAAGAWAAFVLLYLLMYQNSQRANVGIMRSLGASRREATGYLFRSGALVAAIGVALGAVVSAVALQVIQRAIYSDAVAQVDRSVFSAGKVISEGDLWQMVRSSGLPVPMLLALALAQLLILAAILRLHAGFTAGRTPRKLMGV